MREIKKIVVHHTADKSDEPQFLKVNSNHKNRNWGHPDSPVDARIDSLGLYIQYNYFIEKKDTIHACKDQDLKWHSGVGSVNEESISVCLAGNFEEEEPTEFQLKMLQRILQQKIDQYKITRNNVLLHRDVKATACPGKNLSNKFETILNYLTFNMKKTCLQIDKEIGFIQQIGENCVAYSIMKSVMNETCNRYPHLIKGIKPNHDFPDEVRDKLRISDNGVIYPSRIESLLKKAPLFLDFGNCSVRLGGLMEINVDKENFANKIRGGIPVIISLSYKSKTLTEYKYTDKRKFKLASKHNLCVVGVVPEGLLVSDTNDGKVNYKDYHKRIKLVHNELIREGNLFKQGIYQAYVPQFRVINK